MPNCGKSRINRNGSVPTGKRNPEFVAFTKGLIRPVKNELRSVDSEVLRSNYVPIHSRLKSDRAMRLSALLQITLMIFFCAPERRRRFNLRYHRPGKTAAHIDFFP